MYLKPAISLDEVKLGELRQAIEQQMSVPKAPLRS